MAVNDTVLWLALHKTFSGRPRNLKRIVELCDLDIGRLGSLSENQIEEFGLDAPAVKTALSNHAEAADMQCQLEEQGIDVVPFTDERYPAKLADVVAEAPVLYVRGNAGTLDEPAVGIAGSRNASDDALEAAARFGSLAAEMNRVVVTGIAKGVDAAAHQGALARDGDTVAVLAEGILRFRRNIEAAAVVSQFYPSQPWQVSRAMARNEVICGLSDAFIVVAAGDKGGTLDAGNRCRKQGKQLLVFEMSVQQAPGNRILIGKGGVPFNNETELRDRLSWLPEPSREPPERFRVAVPTGGQLALALDE